MVSTKWGPLAGLVVVLWAGSAMGQSDGGVALDANRRALAPISYQNLTLMPIVLAKPAPAGERYLVLDEGMEKGLVKVIEKGDGGEVNSLTLSNGSDEPLFLMAGEVIIGGKQDRIIGKDTIVPARTTEAVPVFCVEHGRWGGRKASFSTAKALAHTELRKSAKYKGQGEVWNEVKSKNAKRSKSNDTDTYRHVAADKGDSKSKLAAYRGAFERAFAVHPRRADIVGFVVAVNGKIAAVESFRTPALYRKLSTKLLQSYYVEAVDQPMAPAAAPVAAKDVTAFMADAAKARAKLAKVRENAAAETVQFDDGAAVKGSTVRRKNGKSDSEAVYDSVYAH